MKIKLITVLQAILMGSGPIVASENAHWGYSGREGPEHWGELSPNYSTCSSGKNQSPINLTNMVEGDLPELKIAYELGGMEVINNGHSIQVNYKPGSSITVEGQSFELKQFHFHSPSENTIEGESFPLEAHFVHANKDGDLAVVTVMYKEGEKNSELEKAWAYMPNEAGGKSELDNTLNTDTLIPADYDYYRFNGSLTTPPCTEGVKWFVMKSYGTVSKEQIEKFVDVMNHDNNRPIQPINARIVIQ